MPTERLVEGWTQRLLFQLKKGTLASGLWTYAAIPAAELAGSTVALVLRKHDGTLVTTSGDVGWSDIANAIVYYDPDAADLNYLDSPLKVHWKLTDANGLITYIPKDEPDTWLIFRV